MKKTLITVGIILAVLLVICGVGGYFLYTKFKSVSTNLQQDLNTNTSTDNTYSSDNTDLVTLNNAYSCSLLTQDLAQQILKVPVTLTNDEEDNSCTYSSSAADENNYAMITLIATETTPAEAQTEFQSDKMAIYDGNTTPVTGLSADDAYYATDYNQLVILKGNKLLMLTLTSPSNPSDQDATVAAAKLILAKVQ